MLSRNLPKAAAEVDWAKDPNGTPDYRSRLTTAVRTEARNQNGQSFSFG